MNKRLWLFKDARDALREAQQHKFAVVGHTTGGWTVYDPRDGAPADVTPEIIIVRKGPEVTTLPLTEQGALVLRSALAAGI